MEVVVWYFTISLEFEGHCLEQIRTADGSSVGAHASPPSPPLIGDFGESRIEIASITAGDPVGLDPTYNPGDTITVHQSSPLGRSI